jgi:hypothetical protein
MDYLSRTEGFISCVTSSGPIYSLYVGVLISLWFFLFAARPKEFFLNVLKKLEQRSYKCVELKGNM